MQNEVAIVKAMYRYDLYIKYKQVVDEIKNMASELRTIFKTLHLYYDKYTVEEISHDEFETFFYHIYPHYQNNDVYELLLHDIDTVEISNIDLLIDILNRVVEEHTKTELAGKAHESLSDLSIDLNDLKGIIDKGIEVIGAANDVEANVCNDSFDSLVNEISPLEEDRDLSFRVPFLREKLGGPAPASLGHIFANPNTGKTSLALFEACGFAMQLEKLGSNDVIVYANNEEVIKRVRLRAFLAMLNQPLSIVRQYSLEAEERWKQRGGDRIKFVGDVTHINDVEKLLKTFRPRVLIIDQGSKVDIKLLKDEGATNRLQKLYNRYRELAKEYDPTSIITLGQADDKATGKLFLNLNNMDSSKVGIPGETDYAIGVGKSLAASEAHIRGLSICKNKLTGLEAAYRVPFDVHSCYYGVKEV